MTRATSSGIGGLIDLEIDQGQTGLYVLAYDTVLLPAPVPLGSPPTWYGMLLGASPALTLVDTSAFVDTSAVNVLLPVPPNPALAGVAVHFQAWCQTQFFGPGLSWSFTNATTVVL